MEDHFKDTGYTLIFGQERGRHIIKIGIVPIAEDRPRIWLHILLYLATIFTTLWAGAMFEGYDIMQNFLNIKHGIPFSFSLMAILTCHELGHYFVSKKMGLITSLPYFIPLPPTRFFFLGTFGALIRTKSIIPDRKSMIRVGLSGPLAGFLVAIPISIIGIALSTVKSIPIGIPYLRMGDSLLFYLIGKLFHPTLLPSTDIYLHPMALAGWFGLFITSINLLPIGQLDGGHVTYGLLFQNRKKIYIPIAIGLLACGILLWTGWAIWGLLAFIMARRDPMIKNSLVPLTRKDIILGIIALLIFILTFIPQPLIIVQ
jgi:membrane-associated protease RseP (regulator of RpoE activity)